MKKISDNSRLNECIDTKCYLDFDVTGRLITYFIISSIAVVTIILIRLYADLGNTEEDFYLLKMTFYGFNVVIVTTVWLLLLIIELWDPVRYNGDCFHYNFPRYKSRIVLISITIMLSLSISIPIIITDNVMSTIISSLPVGIMFARGLYMLCCKKHLLDQFQI